MALAAAGLAEAIGKAGMPADIEEHARKELKRLERMNEASGEYSMARTYLDTLIDGIKTDEVGVAGELAMQLADGINIMNLKKMQKQLQRGDVWWAYFYRDGVRHQYSTGTPNRRQAETIEGAVAFVLASPSGRAPRFARCAAAMKKSSGFRPDR